MEETSSGHDEGALWEICDFDFEFVCVCVCVQVYHHISRFSGFEQNKGARFTSLWTNASFDVQFLRHVEAAGRPETREVRE